MCQTHPAKVIETWDFPRDILLLGEKLIGNYLPVRLNKQHDTYIQHPILIAVGFIIIWYYTSEIQDKEIPVSYYLP